VKTLLVRNYRFFSALLLIANADCSGDGNTEPAAATTIAANTATTISGVAGTAVTPPPSVIIRDQNGDPFAGAPVTFNIASGGGTITGASPLTDANGIATVGEWKLGTTAGSNSLTATSGTLTVTFNATGDPGPVAAMVASQGDNQLAAAGSAVATPPAVVVKDANGNVKSGVTVTFTVGSGGGSVTGGTATSNAQGIATVGSWTLGSAGGLNTLVASATGAPSVTFRATASNPKCAARTPHTFGSTTNGALEADDCVFIDGSFIDFYSTTVPAAGAYVFKQNGGFDTYLDIALADGSVIGENDDESDASNNSAISILLPAGNYLLGAGSFNPGVTGAYTITSASRSPDNTGCEQMFVVKGVSSNQNILSTDCLWTEPPAAPIYADGYFTLLRAGQSVTITMASSAIDSYLELYRNGGAFVTQNDNKDATTKDAQITFTAVQTDYYAIIARTAVASQTGAYTLTIQ